MKHVSLDALSEQTVSHNPAIKKKILLHPGEVPHVTGFSQASFPPGEVAHLHLHDDMHEVFYVLRGNGRMRVDEKEFSISEGSCIQVGPGESHEIINSGNSELVICYFGVEM